MNIIYLGNSLHNVLIFEAAFCFSFIMKGLYLLLVYIYINRSQLKVYSYSEKLIQLYLLNLPFILFSSQSLKIETVFLCLIL